MAHAPEAGLTTLVGFCATHIGVCGASNGDSAAVLATAAGRATVLTKRQPKNPPVGSGAAAWATFEARTSGSGLLAAMTDGVWKYAGWGAVLKALTEASGPACMERLAAAACLPGSGGLQDDFTLVLLESRKESQHG